ncbi:hypothetical protein GCM10020331_006880 [Ectobacillus funiculus]
MAAAIKDTHMECLFGQMRKTLIYRKDLFEDEANKKAFKEQYGYELQPSKKRGRNMKIQLSFFTRDTNRDGQIDQYGTTVFLAQTTVIQLRVG